MDCHEPLQLVRQILALLDIHDAALMVSNDCRREQDKLVEEHGIVERPLVQDAPLCTSPLELYPAIRTQMQCYVRDMAKERGSDPVNGVSWQTCARAPHHTSKPRTPRCQLQ